jgi:hypothetical protein
LTDLNGKALKDIVGVTFSLYRESQGGAPLWLETQNVQPDKSGHYAVVLGSTKSAGLPNDPFVSGEARWLGVQVQGLPEQPRVLVVAVPYALKALDAETLGGKPASAFALATPVGSVVPGGGSDTRSAQSAIASTSSIDRNSRPITGTGTTNFIPRWTSSNTLGNSMLFQSATNNVGIGTVTPNATLDVNGRVSNPTGVAGVSDNAAEGKILSLRNNQVEKFSVDGSGNAVAAGIIGTRAITSPSVLTLSASTNGGFSVQPAIDSGNVPTVNIVGGSASNSVASGIAGAVIGGGGSSDTPNTISGHYGTISGGQANRAEFGSTVGGGSNNFAQAGVSTVCGGHDNTASQLGAIVGGEFNTAGNHSFVGGGLTNYAFGYGSMIPGGAGSQATGNFTFAAGVLAQAVHDGAFVWADSTALTDGSSVAIASTAPNQFTARTTGGVKIVTAIDTNPNSPTAGQPTAGVVVAPGGGSWSSLSDRASKDDFAPVDGQAVLTNLAAIPVMTWRYRSQESSIRHMGPVAQDFRAVFGLGEDDKHINTVDADGVALAAIQALYQSAQEKDKHIEQLENLLRQIQARVAKLESEKNEAK